MSDPVVVSESGLKAGETKRGRGQPKKAAAEKRCPVNVMLSPKALALLPGPPHRSREIERLVFAEAARKKEAST